MSAHGSNAKTISLAIASDHGGFILKRTLSTYLEAKGISISDFGVSEPVRCDYPDYAHKVCQAIQQSDVFSARATKQHNNANVLCLGERVVGAGLAQAIVDAWLESEFEGGRHQTRIDKLMSWDLES